MVNTPVTDTSYVPNAIITSTVYTLSPETNLLDSTEEPSNFISTHPSENPKIPPQLQILHQVTLPDINHLTLQKLLQMRYQQKNLHKLFLLPQNSSLTVEILQACLIYYHLRFQQKNLSHFLFLNQTPLSQWRSLKLDITIPI